MPLRSASHTALTMAPMRRRVRALRRLLGPQIAEQGSFCIEAMPSKPSANEPASEGSS